MAYDDYSREGMTEKEYKLQYVWPLRIALAVAMLITVAMLYAIF